MNWVWGFRKNIDFYCGDVALWRKIEAIKSRELYKDSRPKPQGDLKMEYIATDLINFINDAYETKNNDCLGRIKDEFCRVIQECKLSNNEIIDVVNDILVHYFNCAKYHEATIHTISQLVEIFSEFVWEWYLILDTFLCDNNMWAVCEACLPSLKQKRIIEQLLLDCCIYNNHRLLAIVIEEIEPVECTRTLINECLDICILRQNTKCIDVITNFANIPRANIQLSHSQITYIKRHNLYKVAHYFSISMI